MSGTASGPQVLSTETYFIHPTFSKCEKSRLTARIQFFSGNIVHRMADAQFIMLPAATSVANMTMREVSRVRSSEMLEDHLKKKLGRGYSTYLDLPNTESAHDEESLSDPESDGSPSPKARKSTKPVTRPGARNPASPTVKGRPQPKSSMRRTNPFTQAELRELEKYVWRNPPDRNASGRPIGSWWRKLYEDCEWARTHNVLSWVTWSCRNWDKWFKETTTRRKALEARSNFPAKASISAHSAKASSGRPKRVEAIMLSSSDNGEGDKKSPQEILEVNTVEDPGNTPEAPVSNPEDDRPPRQKPRNVAFSTHRFNQSIDTETESSGEGDTLPPSKAPTQANQPVPVTVRPLSPPQPPIPSNSSRSHLGFACWRRRPRVFVADSDPSQTTATTATTQTTNLGPTQFTQVTSVSVIPAGQKPRNLIQASQSTSQQPQIQSQRSLQAPSASESGTSGQNPWIVPDGTDSDSDYSATRYSFDDSDDDGWSENSSDNGTEDEEPESLLRTGTVVNSGLLLDAGKRHLSVLANDGEGTGFAKLVDKHLPSYFDRAILEYGGTQSQTQTHYQTQATQRSQSQRRSSTKAVGASQTDITPSSQQQQKRRRIINSVLSLVSHWMRIPLPKVRNVWKGLPREKRTFEELQKKCLQCDLSASRKEYDATGLFTQQSPRPRARKWDDGGGPARKRRRLTTFPPLRRGGSSNTEAGFDEDEDSEIYFGGQDPDAPAGRYDGEEDNDGADQEPPPILFRQTRLVPGSAKSLHPYPARPDKEWAKRICRVLAATYGWRRASKVYAIWEEVGGDAKQVEKSLKDKSAGDQKTLLDLGLGDIPRPWA